MIAASVLALEGVVDGGVLCRTAAALLVKAVSFCTVDHICADMCAAHTMQVLCAAEKLCSCAASMLAECGADAVKRLPVLLQCRSETCRQPAWPCLEG